MSTRLTDQSKAADAALRQIIQEENDAWNKGDAVAYSQHFAATGSFTNIQGTFAVGHAAFMKQHQFIFEGIFKNTILSQDIVSLQFVHHDVAVVDTLATLTGLTQALNATLDAKGRLRTRLLQVIAKHGDNWEIVAYHNVDIKAGVPVPDP